MHLLCGLRLVLFHSGNNSEETVQNLNFDSEPISLCTIQANFVSSSLFSVSLSGRAPLCENPGSVPVSGVTVSVVVS